MKQMRFWLCFAILNMLVSSCAGRSRSNSVSNHKFDELYSGCDMNSAVQFIPAKGKFKSGDLVNLSLRNTSMYPVIFPDDRNVKILRFKLNEQRWVEVMNEVNYVPSADLTALLEPANSGLRGYLAVVVIPKFTSATDIEVRIVVNGNLYKSEEKTNECVGAYIDIMISP